jgi:hypothetical protein
MLDERLARNVEIARGHAAELRRMQADVAQTIKTTYDTLRESSELMERADDLLAKH